MALNNKKDTYDINDREFYDSIVPENEMLKQSNRDIFINENSELRDEAKSALLKTWLFGLVSALLITMSFFVGAGPITGSMIVVGIASSILTIISGKDFIDKQEIVNKTIAAQTETEFEIQEIANKHKIKKMKHAAVSSTENDKKLNIANLNMTQAELVKSEANLAVEVSNSSLALQTVGAKNTMKIEENLSEMARARSSALVNNNESAESIGALSEEEFRSAEQIVSKLKTIQKKMNSIEDKDLSVLMNGLENDKQLKTLAFGTEGLEGADKKDTLKLIVDMRIKELEVSIRKTKEARQKLTAPYNGTPNVNNSIGDKLTAAAGG